MKRVLWILVALGIVAWIVNSSIENRKARDADRAERQQKLEAVRARVQALASRRNASSNWVERLAGDERYRFEPVLTIELEELWIEQGPILFIGAVKDIASKGDEGYIVTFERSLTSGLDYFFDTEFRLELTSGKEPVDSLLRSHPDLFENLGMQNGVAVVANVEKVESLEYVGEDGQLVDVKVGVGQIVELLFVGDELY